VSASPTSDNTDSVAVAESVQQWPSHFKDRTDGFGLTSVGVAKNQNLEPTVGLRLAVGHRYARPMPILPRPCLSGKESMIHDRSCI
jgi:hypothetical protein